MKTLPAMIATVCEMRTEAGYASEPFRIITPTRAAPVAIYHRLEDMGVTDIINLPEVEEIGPTANENQKADYIKRFAETYVSHFESEGATSR